MLLAVGTHSFLVIVDLESTWKISRIAVLATGHHYGIALPTYDGKQFIAKGGKGETLTTYKKKSNTKFPWFQNSQSCELNSDYRYIHQIAYYDNGLYIANTDFNCIEYLPFNSDHKPQRYFFNDLEKDLNHVNSVFPCGKNDVLVLLHNRGTTESELVVLRQNNKTGFRLIKQLPFWDFGCHNVFMNEKKLFYNSSDAGDFIAVDIAKQRVLHRINFSGHTKGLSVTNKYIIVGHSDYAERQERYTTKGYLTIIDKMNLKPIATIDLNVPSLPHPIGNVNEIRCLSETDYAHSSLETIRVNWENLHFSRKDRYYLVKKMLLKHFPSFFLKFVKN